MGEAARRKRLSEASKILMPQFLSVLCLALHRRHGFGQKRLLDVLGGVERLFEQYPGDVETLLELCREETGIVIRNEAD